MRLLPRWLLVPLPTLLLLLLLPGSVFGQEPAPDKPGPDKLVVDEFACRGNAATSCDFILAHLYLAPGDTLDEEELGNARLRLASLPSFHSVDIYLEKGSSRGRVRVVIEVTEADPYLREWLAGTSFRLDSPSQLLTGRLTHQNLFGTGKLLDLTMVALVPFDSQPRSEYSARVQYVDPHWLGSKRAFLIAGASAGRADNVNVNGERLQLDNIGFDATLGRRIFDFSYLSLFYRYNAHVEFEQTLPMLDGGVQRYSGSFDNHVLAANYGWNSEDDPYFPTRGSRASLQWIWESTAQEMITEGGFRKTWTTAGGTSWSMQIADNPGTEYRATINEHFDLTGGFARPIAGSADGEIRRGRWYVEAGYDPQGHSLRGERQKEYGLKAGVRLETRSFGLVELYIIGSGLHTRRGEQ